MKERDAVLRIAARKKDPTYWKRGIDLRKQVTEFILE